MRSAALKFSIWGGFAILIVLAPIIFSSGQALSLLGQIGIAVIFALAYNLLFGQSGMLSFGHSIYLGLAGYFTIHFMNGMADGTFFYFPVSLMPLLGGVAGLMIGLPIGFISTRKAGTVFAMISLGFVELTTALTLILISFFNGEEGIQTDRWVGPEPFGITYGPDIQVYYLIGIWCFVSTGLMYFLTKTPFGRIANAVRDNAERVEYIGYNPHRVRWLAFSLSAFFSGVAGALYAINFEHVGFETVSLGQSGLVLIMVFIGGNGHFFGPILGALLITFLNGYLSELSAAWSLYLGLFFLGTVLFLPSGLSGLIVMHSPIWTANPRLLLRLLLPYLMALGPLIVASFGVIALVEMTYFASNRFSITSLISLYGLEFQVDQVGPWVAFGGIALLGIVFCRFSFSKVKYQWHSTIEQVQKGEVE